jgi:hypothetical protein
VNDRQLAHNRFILMERDCINIDGRISQPDEFPCALAVCGRLLDHGRFACQSRRQVGSDRDRSALGVVDRDSSQMLPALKPVNDDLKFLPRASFQIGFDFIRETLPQGFRSMLQITAQTQLLRPHLVIRRKQRDQCDPNDQRNGEANG